jgi:hypothetical protein
MLVASYPNHTSKEQVKLDSWPDCATQIIIEQPQDMLTTKLVGKILSEMLLDTTVYHGATAGW